MDFSHLNKILEKSFSHVKRDILKLKESHLYAQEAEAQKRAELKKALEEKYNEKLSVLKNEVSRLQNSAVQKKDLNSKLLPVYKAVKQSEARKNQIKDINEKFDKIILLAANLNEKNKKLENSRIDVEKLKLQFVLKEVYDKNIKSMNEKIVVQKDYTKAMGDVKKNFDYVLKEIKRIEDAAFKNTEAGKTKARITRTEKTLKDLKKLKADAKDVKDKLNDVSKTFDKVNVKIRFDKKALAEKRKIEQARKRAASKKKKEKSRVVSVKKAAQSRNSTSAVKPAPKKLPKIPKPSKKEKAANKDEGKLFKQAIDGVIDYFTEVPAEEMKPAAKKKAVAKKNKK
ncbi:hypothetical protein GOV08_05500 [Candidatus Woesearchaeota archaeon]|nr:hypothetical protein [Candidatus Woesearchaeota archaeon]